MVSLVLPLMMVGMVLGQTQTTAQAKMALDLNIECVSLLGQKFYRTPAEGDALKKLEDALAEADKNVAATPDDPAAHAARGEALGALWHYRDCVQAYTKAISLAPRDAELYSHRGNIFILLRLFEQAKNDYGQAVAIAPDSAECWIGLGITHFLRHKFEDADKAFAEAERYPMIDRRKDIVAFWKWLIQRRMGKAVEEGAPVPGPAPSMMRSYLPGLEKFLAKDQAGALQAWHAVADVDATWPMLDHIVAESEIAAIKGSKKMNPATVQ